jgi:hypothetical protein
VKVIRASIPKQHPERAHFDVPKERNGKVAGAPSIPVRATRWTMTALGQLLNDAKSARRLAGALVASA